MEDNIFTDPTEPGLYEAKAFPIVLNGGIPVRIDEDGNHWEEDDDGDRYAIEPMDWPHYVEAHGPFRKFSAEAERAWSGS